MASTVVSEVCCYFVTIYVQNMSYLYTASVWVEVLRIPLTSQVKYFA